jgi:hypothetical protein
VKEAETDVKGKFNAAKMGIGNFDFKWELGGYATVSEANVHVGPGKELKRRVVMYKGLTREGDVAAGDIMSLDISGVGGNIQPTSRVHVEVSGGALRFYMASTPNTPPSGGYIEVLAGVVFEKTIAELVDLYGAINGQTPTVQNAGSTMAHWKITVIF